MIVPLSRKLPERNVARHAARSRFRRSLMRELIVSGGLGPGSRVLIAGCGDGELAERLVPFGIQVTGIDEAIDCVERAAGLVPQAEFQSGPTPRSQFDDSAAPFDSVVVLALAALRGSIRSSAALRSTASLLSCLRPGGSLGFLATGPGGGLPHEATCLAAGLQAFPGKVTTTRLVDRWSDANPPPPKLVRLRLDGQRRSPVEWDELVLPLASDDEPCCRFCPTGV